MYTGSDTQSLVVVLPQPRRPRVTLAHHGMTARLGARADCPLRPRRWCYGAHATCFRVTVDFFINFKTCRGRLRAAPRRESTFGALVVNLNLQGPGPEPVNFLRAALTCPACLPPRPWRLGSSSPAPSPAAHVPRSRAGHVTT
eukprot:1324870-Rhodomonas_salina.1